MRISFSRFDSWFLKGFEGLFNLLVDRSNQGKAPETLVMAVMRLRSVIEKQGNKELPDEISDEILEQAVAKLTKILEFRMNYGRLPTDISKKLIASSITAEERIANAS